jgi:hypothetical protein
MNLNLKDFLSFLTIFIYSYLEFTYLRILNIFSFYLYLFNDLLSPFLSLNHTIVLLRHSIHLLLLYDLMDNTIMIHLILSLCEVTLLSYPSSNHMLLI